MTINNSKTFAIFVGLLVFVSCSNAPNEADLILSSSNVILMNADKDAAPLSIAIADKKIIWIGSIKEGKKIEGQHRDYGNQSILPGFIDAHGTCFFCSFFNSSSKHCIQACGSCKCNRKYSVGIKKSLLIKEISNQANGL